MSRWWIENGTIVNDGRSFVGALAINDGRIESVIEGSAPSTNENELRVDASGLLVLPGAIDDQVHFREPGLTHKGEIYTEARAAAAGGITSFMEMPNTIPQTTTIAEWEAKMLRASECSLTNYSFYLGATNSNLKQVLAADKAAVAGIKIFMGSSTGDMLVDNDEALDAIFKLSPLLIATHCESEPMVKAAFAAAMAQYNGNIQPRLHPTIRSREACIASSSKAIALAKKHNTRLHVLHISTAEECLLFEADPALENKRITAEACVHHLWFSDADYERLGNRLKWNPAVKTAADRDAIWKAVNTHRIDVIATDHAPHTLAEKNEPYATAPSGGPLVQQSLCAMLSAAARGRTSIEMVVEKMCHSPARAFQVSQRGYIRPGYWADLVLVDPMAPHEVKAENLHYKCGWSPMEGQTLDFSVVSTVVNGNRVYHRGEFFESQKGCALQYQR